MKVKQSNLVYHLDFLNQIDSKIKGFTNNQTSRVLYNLLLTTSLLAKLDNVVRKNLGNRLQTSNVERTIFNLMDSYK